VPTVAELARWAGPLELSLVAGSAGLAREIARVVRFRSARRDVHLQPGDLVLVPLAEWQRAVGNATVDVTDGLRMLDVAAVLVFGPGLAAATFGSEESCTPILHLPESQLDDAETILTLWLTSAQAHEEQQANYLRGELRQLEHHPDVHDLLKSIVQLTGKTILIHDATAAVVLACQPAGRTRGRREIETACHAASTALGQLIRQKQAPLIGVTYRELASPGLAMLVAAVHAPAAPTRYLSVVGPPAEFAHRDRNVLIAAADAATECMRTSRMDRAQSEPDAPEVEPAPGLLRLLLLGRTQQACSIAQRAGCDLDQAWVGLAFGAEGDAADLNPLCQSISWLLRDYRPLLRIEDDCVLCLVPAETGMANPWQRRHMVERWLAELCSDDATLRIGYTAVHRHANGARQALVEARHALALGRRQEEQSRITTYAAACIRELVSGTQRSALRRQIVESLLRPLKVNDHAVEQELLRTLSVHLDAGCRTLHTAELLGIHRNSVLYRLQRISELTGVDLEDGDTRLLLQLVLRSTDEHAADRHGEAPDAMEPAAGLDVRWFEWGAGLSRACPPAGAGPLESVLVSSVVHAAERRRGPRRQPKE
jgi:purine catabolism regulator